MAREIERKFLVVSDGWRAGARPVGRLRQGYLTEGSPSLRVRVKDGDRAQLTIKLGQGLARDEYEYEIPIGDGEDLLAACEGRLVDKTRHLHDAGEDRAWEIDVYHGPLDGLVTAELELSGEDEPVPDADWLGTELTGDPRWSNAELATKGAPVRLPPKGKDQP